MPAATKSEIWDSPIEKIYEVITNYGSYPEFVDGCSSVNILSQSETESRVEFGLNLIKKFKYTLVLKQTCPTEVSWSFESGDLFKKNEGFWKFKDLGDGRTDVTYSLEVEVKGFAPKSLVSSLAEKNLPAMLKSYQNRCKSH
jgi:ribosome-associated toxin RatA of RatAB toxin-antitoxin module